MIRQVSSYPEVLASWETMITAINANADDAPHLQEQWTQLAAYLEQARAVVNEQAAVTARRQELSRQLRQLLATGARLATAIRYGLKNLYGNDSEKLVEFGLQPLRRPGRSSRPQPPTEPAPTAPPSPTPPVTSQ